MIRKLSTLIMSVLAGAVLLLVANSQVNAQLEGGRYEEIYSEATGTGAIFRRPALPRLGITLDRVAVPNLVN